MLRKSLKSSSVIDLIDPSQLPYLLVPNAIPARRSKNLDPLIKKISKQAINQSTIKPFPALPAIRIRIRDPSLPT